MFKSHQIINMKTNKLLAVLLLLLPFAALQTEAAHKKTTVWEKPVMMYANTGAIEVTRVEFADTATLLYMHAEYTPKEWIRIAAESRLTDADGKTYRLTSADGIVPGKKFFMPDNGETDFTLRFAPMPKGTKMMDFAEGEAKDDWRIFGIHDDSFSPEIGVPKELKEKTYDADETLPVTRYAPGKVKVRFKAYGYRPEMGAKLEGWYSVLGEKQQRRFAVKLNDDGTAEVEAELTHPSVIVAGIPNVNYASIFAVPGEEVSLTLDLANGQKDDAFFGFTGSLAHTNKVINGNVSGLQRLFMSSYDSLMTTGTDGWSAAEYAALISKTLKEKKAEINSFKGLTDAARAILRMDLESTALDWQYDFSLSWEQAKIRRAGIKTAAEYEELKKSLNVPHFDAPLTDGTPMELLESDYAMFGDGLSSAYSDRRPVVINNAYNRQVATVEAFLKGRISLDAAAEATITDPALSSLISEKRAKDKQLQEELARSGNVFFHKLDDVKPADILPMILDKYKGKAVVVDIWATWCGPCKAGHKRMKPLKEELKNEDVVFVYITGPTSPAETWLEMIGGIDGDHYYLTREQYGHILDTYESQGIPTYLVFDREGRLTFKNIGMVANGKIKEEIEKALEWL